MIRKITGLYYSPAGGTKLITEKIVGDLAGMLNDCSPEEVGFECYDLEDATTAGLELNEENIAVIGMPVYLGKIPLPAAKALCNIKCDDVMTLATVSYGGRSYGNALFELQRCAEEAGLKVIGAGAFYVSCRNLLSSGKFVYPAVDAEAIDRFGKASANKIMRLNGCEVEGLRIKPAPVEAPGHMPVHLVSRFSADAAAAAQRLFAVLALRKRHSEWFL